MAQTTFRRTSTVGAVLSLGALLALMPAGASATSVSDAKAVFSKNAGPLKMLKRLGLKKLYSPGATAKRPPRGSRPARRSHVALTRSAGECAVNNIPSYANGVYKPYTWGRLDLNGVSYGYYVYNRYALSFGLLNQSLQCDVYVGNQYEWYRWTATGWYWWADVNCDPYYTSKCSTVRSR